MGLLDKLMKTSTKIENGVLLKAGTKDLEGGKDERVYRVPEKVVKISGNAFKNKNGEWEEINQVVFDGGNVANLPSFSGNNYFNWLQLSNAYKIEEIPARAFEDCKMLTSITMPRGVRKIAESAFEGCEELSIIQDNGETGISLPSTLELIGNNAFKGCKRFTKVTIPHSVTFIGDGAFDCENLKTVEFEGLMPNYREDPFGKSVETVIYRNHEIRLPLNHFPTCPDKPMLRAGQAMQVAPFVDYAIKNNKKLPKQMTIIRDTKPTEVKDFYDHADEFIELTKDYLTTWSDEVELSRVSDDDIISAYHKACIVTGVFSPDEKDRRRAQQFMKENGAKMSPEALVKEYVYFNTFVNGFNKGFADYYINGFEETVDREGRKSYRIAGSKEPSWYLYMQCDDTDKYLACKRKAYESQL